MIIQESAQMYLETVLVLQEEGLQVRSIDIARRMEHSRATVSEWMKKLVANGYLKIDDRGIVTFTREGRKIAESVYERHNVLADVFISIGVSPEVAREDACRVEHYISDETFDCIKEQVAKCKAGRNADE